MATAKGIFWIMLNNDDLQHNQRAKGQNHCSMLTTTTTIIIKTITRWLSVLAV